MSTTKTGVVRSVPLVPGLAGTLRGDRAQLMARQHPGLEQCWVFSEEDGSLLRIKRRFTVHGFRRTFNNIARQVAGEIVTRSITGHVTQAMPSTTRTWVARRSWPQPDPRDQPVQP